MNADKAEMLIILVGYLLDSGSPRSVERCGAGALARGRPPGRPASRRAGGAAPPSRCQSDYLSQADTPLILFLLIEVRLGFGEHIVLTGDPHVQGGQQENIEQHGYHEPADDRSEEHTSELQSL